MDSMVVAPGQNVAAALVHNQGKLGCWEPIKNIEDPYVQEMGRFAVMERTQKLVGASVKFICVVSGEIQLDSEGKVYRLEVKVEEQIMTSPMRPPSIKIYIEIVLEKSLNRSWILLSSPSLPSN